MFYLSAFKNIAMHMHLFLFCIKHLQIAAPYLIILTIAIALRIFDNWHL